MWITQQAADLSVYQLRSERGAANGYASLDATGKVPTAQMPPGQDLSGYQTRAEKGVASGYCELDTGVLVPIARIPDLGATYQKRSERAAANGYATLDATGKVPAAQLPASATGIAPGIPGEVRLWSGSTLPAAGTYGAWVWADGTAYSSTTYPIAAANIATAWRTFGAADPGAGMFRVPDLRGLAVSGMDAMPGGSRANRTTRAAAGSLAGRTGEEYHTLSTAELAAHGHGVNDPSHNHGGATTAKGFSNIGVVSGSDFNVLLDQATDEQGSHVHGVSYGGTGVTVQNAGGGVQHENVPPTVYVPWIVRLD